MKDFGGNIEVVALLLNFPIAAFISWKYRGGRFNLLTSVMVFIPYALLGFLAMLHLCRAGNPVTQWAVPGVAAAIAVPFITSDTTRRIVATVWFVVGLGLCLHYLGLVHGPSYTGNPQWIQRLNQTHTHANLQVFRRNMLNQANVEDADHPAGWYSDFAEARPDEIAIRPHLMLRLTIPLWHTKFTGLYRVESFPADIWYPGGPLSQAAQNLELRVRQP